MRLASRFPTPNKLKDRNMTDNTKPTRAEYNPLSQPPLMPIKPGTWQQVWFNRSARLRYDADQLERARLIEAGWSETSSYPDCRVRWNHPSLERGLGIRGASLEAAISMQRRLDAALYEKHNGDEFPD